MANKRAAKKAETKANSVVEEKKTTKVEKKVEEPKKETKEEKGIDMPGIPKGYVPKPQEKLSYYTVAAMLSVLASAAATIVCFLMAAKPLDFITRAFVEKANSEMYDLYGEDFYDMVRDNIFNNSYLPKNIDKGNMIKTLTIVSGVAAALATLFIIIAVFFAIDKYKKPSIVIDVIAVVFAIVSLVTYVIAFTQGRDIMIKSDYFETAAQMGVVRKEYFNMMHGALIAVIASVVFSIANVVGGFIGLGKWKKNGTSY